MSYKFDYKTRYMTRGVSSKIPLTLQIYLWNLIDEKLKKNEDLDYLQIFIVKNNGRNLKIIHKQEEPPYKNEYKLKMVNEYVEVKNTKIYVIDDRTHSTMLFAEEY